MAGGIRTPGIRWLFVLVPLLLLAVVETLSDTVLDEVLPFPRDTLAVVAVVSVFGLVFAVLAFRRIDTLTGDLRARNDELEARGASARALHRVSLAITSLSDVELVLGAVVSHARELLGADVAVLLLEGPDGRLLPRAVAPPGAAAGHPAAPASPDDPGDPGAAMLPFVDPSRAVVRLAAPLQRGGTTIGLLVVGCAAPRGFDVDEVETLSSLANQATIALEHARLEARLRELAVVEERERIARELHDGIAQVLGYVNTKSQAVDEYLAAGRIPEARAQVADLGAAARAVYVDVRESILGLRGPIEPGGGLGSAVGAYAQRAAEASMFALDLAIGDDLRDLRLDAAAEAHVYRIVQEALTNVRKHAAAGRVSVAMARDDCELVITVDDDGHGMPAQPPEGQVPHYGLRAMRERAAAVEGTLVVGPGSAGRGTSIVLRVPLARHQVPDSVGVMAPPVAVGVTTTTLFEPSPAPVGRAGPAGAA
ncbi:MAG: GAF domain-containing sensor histidine kinase [Chloroflexota bacterium]